MTMDNVIMKGFFIQKRKKEQFYFIFRRQIFKPIIKNIFKSLDRTMKM